MGQQELVAHAKATRRGVWMTALEGRWHGGAVQGRTRWGERPSGRASWWHWCLDHDQASFLQKSDQLAKEGFRLVHQQTFTRPDGSVRYQGVWHKVAQR
jgi:hypothetical protein